MDIYGPSNGWTSIGWRPLSTPWQGLVLILFPKGHFSIINRYLSGGLFPVPLITDAADESYNKLFNCHILRLVTGWRWLRLRLHFLSLSLSNQTIKLRQENCNCTQLLLHIGKSIRRRPRRIQHPFLLLCLVLVFLLGFR